MKPFSFDNTYTFKKKTMECITVEKEGLELFRHKLGLVEEEINKHLDQQPNFENTWIENSQLSKTLDITIRSLQTYRERGIIGSSSIGKKIFYKIPEICELLKSKKITAKKDLNQKWN